jgi:NDP-sugar pyrophosphorylase family protein
LTLIERPNESFLVMNGDLLTDLDFASLMQGHRASDALATLAVYRKPVEITLGVLDLDTDDRITGYTEKPTLHYFVSSGIYCFRPEILDYMERGAYCDLPTLILRLISEGHQVRAHRFDGYWLDIGRPEDYEIALTEVAAGRFT